MYVLGFTEVYYTLWQVDEPTQRFNLHCSTMETVQHCCYIQNLSTDYSKAMAKIEKVANGQKFGIDLELRGQHSFERLLYSQFVDVYELWQFSFGKLAGSDMRECDDIWQLNRAMREEKNKRRRVHARKRLVELGELIRNPFRDIDESAFINKAHYRYLTEKTNKQKISGHFYNEGERVTVRIKRTGGTSYDSQYGTVFIERYITEDGKALKYKGSAPLDIKEEFVTVTGTVEHDVYQGTPETRIKRIKLAEKSKA